MAMGTLESPHMPDLVVDKILRFLPTKAAVQAIFPSKQWQGVVSSFPTLDFNEHDDFDRHGVGSSVLYQRQHHRFIHFLERYLDFRNKDGQKEPLEKLSLRMRTYSHQDSDIITKWLKYASQRDLRELDICPDFYSKSYVTVTENLVESERPLESNFYKKFYRLPWVAIASSAKSLTSLKLGCVEVLELRRAGVEPLFPSLKILSLKAVRVATDQALYCVLRQCPSIEYLSLAYCSIENSKCYVCCSSLKYLEVKYCELDDIRVDRAFNLESFSFVSPRDSNCENMILNSAFNLKYINISVDNYLGEFSLLGCHPALEASFKSKRIRRFEFFDGYLSAKLSSKATIDQPTVDQATILVGELMGQERSSSDPTYVPRLVSFIRSFSCCMEVNIYNQAFQALTVPKYYRRMTPLTSLPLPNTYGLVVRLPNRPPFGNRDYYDELVATLYWIAPSAVYLVKWANVEEDRKKVDQRARPAGHR